MSQIDKLIERICRFPNDIRFDEVRRVLEYYGYKTVTPRGGSHHKFVKEGHEIIVIPKHGIVKRVYLEMIKEIIEEEKKNENSR